jgi:hypothetical protein
MRIERVLGTTLIILFSLLFFIKTGTITSGFHFRDDQLYISTHLEVLKKGVFQTAYEYISGDIIQRFRPLFWMHRVLEAKVFGIHFLALSIYTFLLFIATQLLFYVGLKRKGFSFYQILVFLGIAFLGEPSVIWWELGPNETLSTFLIAVSFYFMTNNNRLINNILFSFFLILAAISKESFAIVIPSFIVLKYYFDNQIESIHFVSWIKLNKWIFFPLVSFLAIMLFIVFFIGANSTGYAGVDSNLKSLLLGVYAILSSSMRSYILFIILLLVIIYFGFRDEKKWMNFLRKLFLPMLVVFLILVPNLLLHAKTGMWNRYFTPSSLGLSFAVLFILQQIRYSMTWLYKFLIVTSTFFVFNLLVDTYLLARNFTKEGARNQEVLSLIEKNKSLVIVANPLLEYEWSISLSMYLNEFSDVKYSMYPVEYTDQHSTFGTPELRKELEYNWRENFKNKLFNKQTKLPNSILFLHPSESKNIIEKFPDKYVNKVFNSTYSLYQLK